MKTVLEKQVREEIISRINLLNSNSKPEWGKMNVSQMLQHCILCDEMFLGKKEYKRTFLGKLIGKWALKNMLKDEKPLEKNAPTSPYFKIAGSTANIEDEKHKWITLIKEYESFSGKDFVHWFFGPMTKEQIGQFAFKHTDHHLQQFGV